MPRDDQVVRTPNTAAPYEYTVPQNVELILRGVRAKFADNGAGGDWLPCVDLISDSGHRIARCADPNVKVTAGDDADVSWFPGVKPAAAGGATATTLAYAQAFRDSLGGLPDPVQGVNAGTSVNASFPHAFTTDSSIMDWFTSSQTNDTVQLKAVGTYILWVTTHWDLVTVNLATVIFTNTGTGFPHTPWQPNKVPRFGAEIGTADNMDTNTVHVTTSGRTAHCSHSNNGGTNQAVQQCYFTAVYLGTG